MSEAVVAGHICLDVFPSLLSRMAQFTPGHTIEAGPAAISTGGAVSNTGLALHMLGVSTQLMGKVGSDLFGQAILQILEARGSGLSHGMIVARDEATSYSIILSTPQTDRILIHAPGCNATFGAGDVRFDVLEAARIFHFGYPPLMERMYAEDGIELAALFRRVKAMGLTTSLDLSLPDPRSAAGKADWQAILAATLPYVDLFLPSALEILLLLHRPVFEQLITHPHPLAHVPPALISDLGEALLDMGAKIVGLKIGDRGLYLRTSGATVLAHVGRGAIVDAAAWSTWADRELWSPCFAVEVAGTTGSGDATIAGLLMGLLHGMTLPEALTAACAVGACSVEAVDGPGGIRPWEDTAQRLAAGWPRLLLPLVESASAWRWDSDSQLWIGPKDKSK